MICVLCLFAVLIVLLNGKIQYSGVCSSFYVKSIVMFIFGLACYKLAICHLRYITKCAYMQRQSTSIEIMCGTMCSILRLKQSTKSTKLFLFLFFPFCISTISILPILYFCIFLFLFFSWFHLFFFLV